MSRSLPSRRPYFLRAMHQWITDCGYTPQVIVAADADGAEVPRAHVRDGKIVLNISFSATRQLELGNEWLEFGARFSGVAHQVRVPIEAVLAVYSRETGEGMVFDDTTTAVEPAREDGSEAGVRDTNGAADGSRDDATGSGAAGSGQGGDRPDPPTRPPRGPRPAPGGGSSSGGPPRSPRPSGRPRLKVVK
jgi:stringent starvation protein B